MAENATSPAKVTPAQLFWTFLKLGTTSFGGPIAHLGYFRTEFVERRRWMSDKDYADLVAICQFLPGPASSQVGFGIGLRHAGFTGAIAAFLGFTLPSLALMIASASGAALIQGTIGQGLLTGLKIVAVAIVAQAVWGMARTLTPDRSRASIAVGALVLAAVFAGTGGQIAALAFGVLAGLILCRPANNDQTPTRGFPVRPVVGIVSLGLFFFLLIGAPIAAATLNAGEVSLFDAFYRAGALVFGGGHVVLPLLQTGVVDPGWVSSEQFLAGYGVTQAMPGPLFTFAGYLGALAEIGPGGIWGGLIAVVAVFLPGFLLLVGILPFWNAFQNRTWMQAAMRGANAAVVGILAAALYSPVFTSVIIGPMQLALAAVWFVLLIVWKTPPWIVVLLGAAGGILLELL